MFQEKTSLRYKMKEEESMNFTTKKRELLLKKDFLDYLQNRFGNLKVACAWKDKEGIHFTKRKIYIY